MKQLFTSRNTITFLAIATLSGCAATSEPDGPTAPTYAELQADLTDVADEMASVYAQGSTPVAAFTNGTVTYSGYVQHTVGGSIGIGEVVPSIPPTETVLGELTVSADFNSSGISASIYNLVSDTRGSMPGTLGGQGQIDYVGTGEAANFTFDVTGSLLINGRPASYDGGLNGTFYGTSPNLVFVGVDGTIHHLSGGTEDFDLTGYALVD